MNHVKVVVAFMLARVNYENPAKTVQSPALLPSPPFPTFPQIGHVFLNVQNNPPKRTRPILFHFVLIGGDTVRSTSHPICRKPVKVVNKKGACAEPKYSITAKPKRKILPYPVARCVNTSNVFQIFCPLSHHTIHKPNAGTRLVITK